MPDGRTAFYEAIEAELARLAREGKAAPGTTYESLVVKPYAYKPEERTMMPVLGENAGRAVRVKVYISGPIANAPGGNRVAFADRARELESAGYDAVNPHEISHEHPGECYGVRRIPGTMPEAHLYGCFLMGDLLALGRCDFICILPGWEDSDGAVTEVDFARACHIPVLAKNEAGLWVASSYPTRVSA